MSDLKPCSECGGEMIAVDVAGKDDRPALIRDNFGRFFSRDSLIHLEHAHACLGCGHTRFYVDPVKLKKRGLPRWQFFVIFSSENLMSKFDIDQN